ncbi:uncharacterized protein TrAtP1_005393 [Trichoderma atroviride]|uniref:uncharacterized protein n=1 Tax=Hypocrea atroviridis TaxID=63577 RepID=UPI00331F2815|nr:hypothetical protein TrAtP1_005393 [Trichoderma atroviride]
MSDIGMAMADRFGLQLVTSGNDSKVDIVFLHGLRGDVVTTWSKDFMFWPGQLLPVDIPDARIYSFGYDSSITHTEVGNVTETKVNRVAGDLLTNLAEERSKTQTDDRPIIIVAHSLGGLVAARLFVHGERRRKDSNANSTTKYIRGIIFLGTPFRNSIVPGLPGSISNILQLVGVDTQEQTLGLLGVDFERLNELTSAFSSVLKERQGSKDPNDKIDAFFFYEALPTKIGSESIQIVEKESAQLPGCGDGIPVKADHGNICKFKSAKDDDYLIIISVMRKILMPPNAESSEVGS